jgi:hypothetical protein
MARQTVAGRGDSRWNGSGLGGVVNLVREFFAVGYWMESGEVGVGVKKHG